MSRALHGGCDHVQDILSKTVDILRKLWLHQPYSELTMIFQLWSLEGKGVPAWREYRLMKRSKAYMSSFWYVSSMFLALVL